MLMLISFPKKSSFDANRELKAFKIALRGRSISWIGAMWNLLGTCFCWVVGIWQGVFLTIGTIFKAKNNILCMLNILNIFPGGGKGIGKFLASVWRLAFIPLVRKNPAIFAKFVPKFQNIVSHNSLDRSCFNLNIFVWWITIDREK